MRGAFLMRALGCLVVMVVAAGAGFWPAPGLLGGGVRGGGGAHTRRWESSR